MSSSRRTIGDRTGRPRTGAWYLLAAVVVFGVTSLGFGVTAHAQAPGTNPDGEPSANRTSAERNVDGWVLSMDRGDVSSVYICGEISAGQRWGFAGCGSGAGFLYPARPGETDLAHFRADYGIPLLFSGPLKGEFGPGFGFVELQRGRDEPGLRVAPGEGPEVHEASGPEAALELELEAPAGIGPLKSLRAKWNAGVAWVPDAPAVVQTDSEVVTFSTVSVNGSF